MLEPGQMVQVPEFDGRPLVTGMIARVDKLNGHVDLVLNNDRLVQKFLEAKVPERPSVLEGHVLQRFEISLLQPPPPKRFEARKPNREQMGYKVSDANSRSFPGGAYLVNVPNLADALPMRRTGRVMTTVDPAHTGVKTLRKSMRARVAPTHLHAFFSRANHAPPPLPY